MKTPSLLAAVASVAALVAGCATSDTHTSSSFPQPTELWESFSGQLQHVSSGKSVIGEFVASRHATDFHLEFSKGGAVPLIKVSRHDGLARAEGPLARGRWQGEASAAPEALRGWVDEVPRAFLGLERNMVIPRGPTRPRVDVDWGRPKRFEVPGGVPGEKFVFILNR
jgi:hypothetical protein